MYWNENASLPRSTDYRATDSPMELSRRWYGSPTPPSKGNEWERGHLMYLNIDHAIHSCFYFCGPSCWTQGNASLASIIYPPSSRTFGKTTSCPSSVIAVVSIPRATIAGKILTSVLRAPRLFLPLSFSNRFLKFRSSVSHSNAISSKSLCECLASDPDSAGVVIGQVISGLGVRPSWRWQMCVGNDWRPSKMCVASTGVD
jgi:hypothetical protein